MTPNLAAAARPLLVDRAEAIGFLLRRIDYERGAAIPYDNPDFKLDRMRALLGLLGDPHLRLKIVHVAGTKGKGSTSAMIAAILSAAGLKTGLFSSPHLDRVEERIALDGLPCPTEEFAELVERLRPAVEALDRRAALEDPPACGPTYFEIVTAIALARFAEQAADAAVLEVGLGGRLDSTNVCQPVAAVITSISYDHMQQLGDTLSAIATEKAGIIKPGAPVICGVTEAEPLGPIEAIAAERGAALTRLGRDFDFSYRPPKRLEEEARFGQLDFHYLRPGREHAIERLDLQLLGEHQAANAAVALATIAELNRQGWAISEGAIRSGLTQVRWPARVEVIRRRPTVVLDAAHNVASVRALVRSLDESFSPGPRLLVLATTREKDVRGMLEVLLPRFDEVIFTRYANNPRGVPAEELLTMSEELAAAGLQDIGRIHLAESPLSAWRLARTLASENHLIAVTGSFFIAAEFRAAILRDESDVMAGIAQADRGELLPAEVVFERLEKRAREIERDARANKQ